MQNSRIASVARGIAILALVLFAGGPLAIQLGVLPPEPGFRLFMLGGLFGLVALLLGLLGLFLTRPASGNGGRGAAATASVIGALLVGTALALAAPTGGLPLINDITTDTENPPEFAVLASAPHNPGRDMAYPPDFAAQQRAGYPTLAGISLEQSPNDSLDSVERAATALGWEVVGRDNRAGRIEATETSAIFRFVDDVVVEVRNADGGSRIEVRSKSRVGRGDLGANAARIEALLDALR